jgi:hypothetical protein
VKYILIIWLCTFGSQPHCTDKYHIGQFNTWFDCAEAGYSTSHSMFVKMNKDLVNKEEVALRFECQKLRYD